MSRWRAVPLVVLALTGCRPPEPGPVAVPAEQPAVVPSEQPGETIDALVGRLVAKLQPAPAATGEPAPAKPTPAEVNSVLSELDELEARLPGGEAQRALRSAGAALAAHHRAPDADALEAVKDAVAAARDCLRGHLLRGAAREVAEDALEAAEAALQAERWPDLRLELERAAAMLLVTCLQAPLGQVRAALVDQDQADLPTAVAALRALARNAHLVAARERVAAAVDQVDALALGDARGAVEATREELQAYAGESPSRQSAIASLLHDLDGVEDDLQTGAPGLAERLEALYKKLGREPLPRPGQQEE